jgi:hypothetical protein
MLTYRLAGGQRWIFAESVRRTTLMAYSVITMYELLKDPERGGSLQSSGCTFDLCADTTAEDLGPWAYVHRWTLARPLWDASSSFEFHRAWRETPHFIIANFSLEKFLEQGRAEDVDEFAEVILSVLVARNLRVQRVLIGDNRYMGVDATKEFVSTRATQNVINQ